MILLLYLSYYNGNLVLIVLTRLYYLLTQNDIIYVVYKRLLDNYPIIHFNSMDCRIKVQQRCLTD